MKKSIILCGLVLGIIILSTAMASATTVSSGDLGNNVIPNGGTYIINLNVPDPDNNFLAELVTKYGLWNSPPVPVEIFFNNNLVGDFLADHGYISPGPEFITFDISGLLLIGSNEIKYVGSGSGAYVIGQADINYNQTAVPLPGAVWLLGSGLLGLGGWRRFRKS